MVRKQIKPNILRKTIGDKQTKIKEIERPNQREEIKKNTFHPLSRENACLESKQQQQR